MMTNPKNRLLQSIYEHSPYGIMAFEAIRNEKNEIIDFKWTHSNPEANKMINFKESDLIGKNMLDILPGNKETGLFDLYKKTVNTGEKVELETPYSLDGISSWFRIIAVKMNDGFMVTFQDISNLKKSIIQAENKEAKISALFKESIDPIFILDSKGELIEYNASFNDFIKFDKSTNTPPSFASIFHESKQYSSFINKIKNNISVEEEDYLLVDLKGNLIECQINCISTIEEKLIDKDDKVYIGIIRDISKRKKAEKEIRIAEKLSMTGKIARTIGHEIRNPLTNINLSCEQLKDDLKELDGFADIELYFNIISRNTARINKLISDLLNSSKPRELQLNKQSLNEQVKQSLELINDRTNLMGIKVIATYDESLEDIMLDSNQIQISFLNLFVNAIEAMKSEKGILKIKTYKEKEWCKIDIKDNGKGISEENIEKLFEPFFTAKKEGTGLGLTTVQNIITSHRGHISVESNLGEGTLFTIAFPLE